MGVQIRWDCNLDLSDKSCVPQYTFRRLDSKDPDNVAPGYNFRFAIIELQKASLGFIAHQLSVLLHFTFYVHDKITGLQNITKMQRARRSGR